ncbi:MAG TPA: polysaccharide biosynthesis/export family protein [Acetobacteraceae bacterium]|nr:polysaccharide biosynthesis/export family protein [Acetobacteraceae bacterium]
MTQPPASGGLIGVPSFIPGQPQPPPDPIRQPAAPPVQALEQRSLIDIPGAQRGTQRPGSPTQAEGGPTIVVPLGEQNRQPGPATAVFGASLFTGQPAMSSDAPNPNYILAPGDRVSVRAWGAVDAEVVGVIDPSGNLFLPNVGPLRVAGTRVGDLQRVVDAEIRRVYTAQVQVYATVLSTQRIGVFVTGSVRTPGRFAGVASDSVLDFLIRAGGVDPGRGSYRDITVMRDGRPLSRIDLYRFLLRGEMPLIRLQEGDTIVVARQRSLIGADGAVRNNYLFEPASAGAMSGRDLISYAAPLPAATNAVVRGVRNAQPFSRYVTVQELQSIQLQDQDTVTFIADVAAQTIRVSVEGSRLYPSVLVADRDMSLCSILDHIAVDPNLANTEAIFLLRPSVAQQQRRAIDDALDRLERQLFLSPSSTPGVAQVRAEEARLISTYIERARRIQPEGRIVVADGSGRCAPTRLQNGDVIVIPERSQTVLVQGEVNSPQPVLWRQGMTMRDFLAQAGGVTARGSASNLMIRRPSGQVILNPSAPPRPGDELIALPVLDPKYFTVARDVFALIFQSAVVANVFRNW